VGVGYRDKGHKRDLAKDGSPDWKEVASEAGQRRMQRLSEIDNINSSPGPFTNDIERIIKKVRS
jgi:hypothetical protein